MAREAARHRLTPLWALVLLAFAGCGNCGGGCGRAPERTATRLERFSGQVSLLRAGKARAPSIGMALLSGDVLSTGPKGWTLLRYPDGAAFRIGPNTKVRLDESGSTRSLELLAGTLTSHAPDRVKKPLDAEPIDLSIDTRYGKTKVLPGAELSFTLNGDRPGLSVVHGKAQVIRSDGKPVTLLAGQTLSFTLHAPTHEKPGPVAPARPKPPGKPLAMRLSALRGAPKLKRPGHPKPSRISRRGAAVRPGAAFEIPSSAEALLHSGSTRLVLLPRARGTIGPSTAASDGETHTLDLEVGAVRIRSGSGPSRIGLKLGAAPVELITRQETWLSAKLDSAGPTVAVWSGAARLDANGKALALAAGEEAQLRNGVWRTLPRPTPVLVLPTRRHLRVHADRLRRVGLRLPPEARWVEVARDPHFHHLVARGAAKGMVIVPAPSKGRLFWRTKAAKGKRTGRGSASFELDGGRSVLSTVRPVVEVRATGFSARILHQTALPEIAFDFSRTRDARRYRVAVYRRGHTRRPVATRTVRAPPCRLPPGTLRDGRYVWSATALGKGGKVLSRGSKNALEIAYDNARPQLAIAEPKPFRPRPADGWVTSGVAPRGTKLFVDGEPVPLDSHGRFKARIARGPGLVYRLVSKNGRESFWIRGPRPYSRSAR